MSSIHTFSARDFTQNVSAAKRAATEGPVFITDRGRPAFALLKIEDYYQLTGKSKRTFLELMDSAPASEGIEFEPERLAFDVPAASFD